MAEPREFLPLNIAILTVSDTRTLADDKSGQTLQERIAAAGQWRAGLVVRMAQSEDRAARPNGTQPPMARVLLRKLLRYRGVAVCRGGAARRIHTGGALARGAAEMVRAYGSQRRNLDIIGVMENLCTLLA